MHSVICKINLLLSSDTRSSICISTFSNVITLAKKAIDIKLGFNWVNTMRIHLLLKKYKKKMGKGNRIDTSDYCLLISLDGIVDVPVVWNYEHHEVGLVKERYPTNNVLPFQTRNYSNVSFTQLPIHGGTDFWAHSHCTLKVHLLTDYLQTWAAWLGIFLTLRFMWNQFGQFEAPIWPF